jgi:hypothetical protein
MALSKMATGIDTQFSGRAVPVYATLLDIIIVGRCHIQRRHRQAVNIPGQI